jgi:hypothetical protein
MIGAFLAGHAAADADHHALGLQVLDAAEVAEDLLLGLLAHRAGVEQDEVGLFGVVRRGVALGGFEHIGHLVRVVLVHLAAEGLDVDLLADVRVAAHGLLQVWLPGLNCQLAASAGVRGQSLLSSSAAFSTQTSRIRPLLSIV